MWKMPTCFDNVNREQKDRQKQNKPKTFQCFLNNFQTNVNIPIKFCQTYYEFATINRVSYRTNFLFGNI